MFTFQINVSFGTNMSNHLVVERNMTFDLTSAEKFVFASLDGFRRFDCDPDVHNNNAKPTLVDRSMQNEQVRRAFNSTRCKRKTQGRHGTPV